MRLMSSSDKFPGVKNFFFLKYDISESKNVIFSIMSKGGQKGINHVFGKQDPITYLFSTEVKFL